MAFCAPPYAGCCRCASGCRCRLSAVSLPLSAPRAMMEGAIIFDADGTLADSLPPHVAFVRAMNAELQAGLELPEDSDLEGCRGLAAAPMDNFLRRAGFAEADVAKAVRRYEADFATDHPVALFDGVPALLRQLAQLRQNGTGVRLAVVSSNTSKNVEACLANGVAGSEQQQQQPAPLADCFEFIWGIDNAARSKSDSLAQAAAKLGLAPHQIVYVGDTEKDARCAQECGMHFLGANWGGFEDMGLLAAASAAAADGAEGSRDVPARFEALASPADVAQKATALILASSATPASVPLPSPSTQLASDAVVSATQPPSERKQAIADEPVVVSPYDSCGWWATLTFSWMTALYDKKGADLRAIVDTETAFADWTTPRKDAPEIHAEKLQQAWHVAGKAPTLLNVFWSIYGRWWLQTGSLKLLGMLSTVGTPLLIKAFLGQLQLHTASTVGAEEPWPFWTLLALVPMMTLSSFMYTFVWHHVSCLFYTATSVYLLPFYFLLTDVGVERCSTWHSTSASVCVCGVVSSC